jgi:predicted transcriptional regulator
MKLERLATMTGFMRHGMTLRDFFKEAVRCNVPGLPFVDAQDKIVGRISLRNIYKRIAVPDNLLIIADAMGDGEQIGNLDLPEMKVRQFMASPVEDFLLETMPSVSPRSSIVKALALMEVHNSSYIFLIEDGRYEGVVTRMEIAGRMLECVQNMERNAAVPQ